VGRGGTKNLRGATIFIKQTSILQNTKKLFMLEDQESRPPSPKEKFNQQAPERFELWSSIVDDSEIEDEVKEEIKNALTKFRDKAFNAWDSLDDAVYYTISHLLAISKKSKKKDEARAVFENVRDDLWAFWKEVKE